MLCRTSNIFYIRVNDMKIYKSVDFQEKLLKFTTTLNMGYEIKVVYD